MITLEQILKLKDKLPDLSKVKLVRHKDSRIEYRDIIKDRAELLKYQAEQKKDIFDKCDYIVSFIGQENKKSLFFGVFKINSKRIDPETSKFHYDISEVEDFDDYVDRVVISWGDAALAWHQWYLTNDKELLEILPKGYLGEYPGNLNFILDFSELERLILNPDANKIWLHNLSAVSGVYLILDTKTGNQYIGSAYGKEGIWQRWSTYISNKHGGNKQLVELLDTDSNYYKNFRFTVLQTLPSNASTNDVVAIENLYKEKFGTRLFGLNSN